MNLCPYLHQEFCNYTHVDHAEGPKRVLVDDETTNHFDLLDAFQNAVFGLEGQVKSQTQKSPTLAERGLYDTKTALEQAQGR